MSIDQDLPPTSLEAPKLGAPHTHRCHVSSQARWVNWPDLHSATVAAQRLTAFVLALGLSTAFAGAFNADYSAPGSDSAAAQDLLSTLFPTGADDTVTLVAHSTEPGHRAG